MINFRLRVLGCFVLAWVSVPAWAFHIGQHSQITTEAVEELRACLPGSLNITQDVETNVIDANLSEDRNILRAIFSSFSHFYHPLKKVDLTFARRNAYERVQELEQEFHQLELQSHDPAELASSTGHMIHFLQDMAVPTHVVPVSHTIGDSFEGYHLDGGVLLAEKQRTNICSFLESAPLSPTQILHQTALTTLNSVYEPFTVLVDNRVEKVDWQLFWEEGKGSEMGNYGRLGNAYGSTVIPWRGVTYEVDRMTYQGYKARQHRVAVEVTKKALYWMLETRQRRL